MNPAAETASPASTTSPYTAVSVQLVSDEALLLTQGTGYLLAPGVFACGSFAEGSLPDKSTVYQITAIDPAGQPFLLTPCACTQVGELSQFQPWEWVGGFAQSNPQFAYPTPDLSTLPMLDNLANIPLLQRQQGVKWPEFSWETAPGSPSPGRCFQMFSPYISRLGYTATGRVYSIICPQQGIAVPKIGFLNVEVTVTGQRGWVDEPTRTLAADMTVEGKIWFSPSANDTPFVKLLWRLFDGCSLPFPDQKANAIRVTTHRPQSQPPGQPASPSQPIFPVLSGEATGFKSPDFARHPAPEGWAVANTEVQIGPLLPSTSAVVDEFNQLVIDVFNLASGNMLLEGNVLSWNVWFQEPAPVDQQEWQTHAARWRDSIDEDHGSPTGPGTPARYFDGTPFNPVQELLDAKIEEILAWATKHFFSLCRL